MKHILSSKQGNDKSYCSLIVLILNIYRKQDLWLALEEADISSHDPKHVVTA